MKSRFSLTALLFIGNVAFVAAATQWMGCATPQQNTYHEPTQPGLYNITGWNNAGVYWPTPGQLGTAPDVDVDGTIGHPFTLWSPSALAIPTHNWNGQAYVTKGTLPPGLSLGSDLKVTGIPTERGHWIVTLELETLYTNGQSYAGFTQVVRFHITGSGDVNQ